jgi:hypothetical protein
VVRTGRDPPCFRVVAVERAGLQPRGNVHTITEQVPSANHHVTDVDINAETDAPVNGEAGVRFSESTLRFHSSLYRVNSASKFGEDTIARRIRYAAPVFPNEPVENRPPFGQSFERADLVSAHEAAIPLRRLRRASG